MDEIKADEYYQRQLLIRVFGRWIGEFVESKELQTVAEEHCRARQSHKVISTLVHHTTLAYQMDYHYRLAATMHCLILLQRGVKRWRHWLQTAKTTQCHTSYRRACRWERHRKLRQFWNRLSHKHHKHQHFLQQRQRLLASDEVQLQHLFYTATSKFTKSSKIPQNTTKSLKPTISRPIHAPMTPPPLELLQAPVAVSQEVVPQVQAKPLTTSSYRLACLHFLQKLSFQRVFQQQERQHYQLTQQLYSKRITRRYFITWHEYQDRSQQVAKLLQVCAEHALHQRLRHFLGKVRYQQDQRLHQLQQRVAAIRHHEVQCYKHVMFGLKEYGIQRHFEKHRIQRCYDLIAMPNSKRRVFLKLKQLVLRSKKQRVECIQVPVEYERKKSKKSSFVSNKVMLFIIRGWRSHRLQETLQIWKLYQQDFRQRHKKAMAIATQHHDTYRLHQSLTQWKSQLLGSKYQLLKRSLRRATFHHANRLMRNSFTDMKTRLQVTRKQWIQSHYISTSFYKLFRYQKGLTQWKQYTQEKRQPRDIINHAKQRYHDIQQRICKKQLLCIAMERDGDRIVQQIVKRYVYRQWKEYVVERRRLKIDSAVKLIQAKPQEWFAVPVPEPGAAKDVTSQHRLASQENNLTAMLARTPPRYSSALYASSPLMLSPTSVTDAYGSKPAASDGVKYFAARAPPRLFSNTLPMHPSTAAHRPFPPSYSTFIPNHVVPNQRDPVAVSDAKVTKRDKLLVIRDVLQFIQEQRSLLDDNTSTMEL